MERMFSEKLVTNVGCMTLRASSMKAIDRVMAAYAKSHKLTDAQAEMVRRELSLFIDQFIDDRMPKSRNIKLGDLPISK
jgi:TnpA family transposase